VMSFLFSLVRASEPLSASLTRSTDFAGVIHWPVATALGDHLTNFNRPLMPAVPAVPDITIDAAERPVGVATAARLAILTRVGSHRGLLLSW
jgi:hypothetical protein